MVMREDIRVSKAAGLCDRLIAGKPDLGVGVWVGPFCVLDATGASLTIGEYTTICTAVQILTHSTENRDMHGGEVFTGSVRIGRRCFIGGGAIIEPNVAIGDFVKIGATSFVRRGTITGNNETWAGAPAVKKR